MKKEMMKCPDGEFIEIGVINFDELESMSDSKFKNVCKNTWGFTKNFIRKGVEFQVRLLKALKLQIESIRK